MNSPALSRFIIVCLMACLASCTSPGNVAVHQARGKFQSRKTYAQGIIGGAIAGALVGTAIAAISGGNGNSLVSGALIGGGAGAVAGGIYANHVVKQRQAYAAKEGALDNAIANASATRKAASDFNKTLARELRNKKLNSETKAGTVADGEAVLSSLNREINRQNQALAASNSHGVSSRDQQRLRNEINGLRAESKQLQSMIDTLNTTPRPSALVRNP